MVTGKNKEQFEKWYLDKFNKCDKYDNWADYWLLRFYECPFEMQIGVYLAYYDGIGMFIDIKTEYQYTRDEWEDGTNPHYVPKDWYFDIHNKYKNISDGGGFKSRKEAYEVAFKTADVILTT